MPSHGDDDYDPPSQRPATRGQIDAVSREIKSASQAAQNAEEEARRVGARVTLAAENAGCQFWILLCVGLLNAALLIALLLR